MAEAPPLNRIYVFGYSANDRDYPVLSMTADPRVAGYQVPKDLSACPDKRYPNHVFTGAQPISGDQRVRHVWEILPSPWVPFTRYDDDLGPVQGRRRSVKNEGQVAVRQADKQVTYEAREGSAIVYTELEETWSIATDDDGNSLFPIRIRDFYDEARGSVQEFRQLITPNGTEVGSITNDNGIITKISYEPYNEYLSFKIIETWSENGVNLNGSQTGTWGVESSQRTLVPSSAELEFGFGIKSSTTVPISKEQSEKRQENYPNDDNNDGVIYTLTGQEQDETSKAIIKIEKSLVEAATVESGRVANYISNLRNDGYVLEVQPLDKWHSITIASKIIGAPQNESWTETGSIDLPDVLDEVGVIWNTDIETSEDAAGVDNISEIVTKEYRWQLVANASATGRVAGNPYVRVKAGYRGAAKMNVNRIYHFGPPQSGLITIHKFEPVYGTINIFNQSAIIKQQSYANGVGGIKIASGTGTTFNNDATLITDQFGPVEWSGSSAIIKDKGDAKTVTNTASASSGSIPGGGSYPTTSVTINLSGSATIEIPTSSIPKTSGQTFIRQVDVKPWRLGWWIEEVYQAIVP